MRSRSLLVDHRSTPSFNRCFPRNDRWRGAAFLGLPGSFLYMPVSNLYRFLPKGCSFQTDLHTKAGDECEGFRHLHRNAMCLFTSGAKDNRSVRYLHRITYDRSPFAVDLCSDPRKSYRSSTNLNRFIAILYKHAVNGNRCALNLFWFHQGLLSFVQKQYNLATYLIRFWSVLL